MNAIVRSCCSRKPARWLVLFAAALLGGNASAAESVIRLATTNTPSGLAVTWTSPSLTPVAPFVHYEFQVEYSADLNSWRNATVVPGGFLGSASVPRSFVLPKTNTQGFVRLNYRLNMPGANLSGLDLSGADLRGANLAGANLAGTKLDGALLGGANVSGANLAGATFAGANLQDVDLTGFDLSAIDLSTILGMPSLTQVTANPLGSVAELIPHLPYNSDASDLVVNDPNIPGAVSTRHAMLMLKTNATVGQLNALLAARGASIVASSPADATLPNAVLMTRFPTTSAQALFDITQSLTNEPIIEAAAPDTVLGLNALPDNTGAAATWSWDPFTTPSGGNWGLERARVPQMWNVYGALLKKGSPTVQTCIIDDRFSPHLDLSFAFVKPADTVQLSDILRPGDHGNHVAGTVGATYGNRMGIDGINPLASLVGYEYSRLNGYNLVQDLRDALRRFPTTRIVNMSLGYNWYQYTNANRPTFSSPFPSTQLARIESVAFQHGLVTRNVAASAGSVLIVCAAGNDSGLVDTRVASPMCAAALTFGAPNILVVRSHNQSGLLSLFSNPGGHVAAPGEAILSASATNATNYSVLQGTSMATPFVTGVAGFLLATAPSLTPAEVITLIQKSQPNVDAYTSLLEIDRLPSRQITHDREVLKMLLDIDDGSLDGSQRVRVPGASLGRDRAFELVTGADFENQSLFPGDDQIDMADFRRWRDWLLHGEGRHALNGSADHLKLDANADGTVHPYEDSQLYPRGDFNGDGVIDKALRHPVPGWLLNLSLTDLQVLTLSGLWEDECFPHVLELPGLIDSADFHVSATNVFYKEGAFTSEAKVAAYHAATRARLSSGDVCLSRDNPLGVLTVPVGGQYYLASEPIPMGGGTNVQIRTEGTVIIATNQRGADYVVDLTLREMTVVADTFNPRLRDIDSTPDTNRVEAYLGTSADSTNAPTRGVRSSADEDGTLHSMANADSLGQLPDNPSTNTTFSGAVRWQRSFTKDSSLRDPRFFLESLKLELLGFGATTNELSAFAEFMLEIRAYDRSPAWEPVFFHRAEIAGRAATGGQPHTFRIVGEEGDFPPKPLDVEGSQKATYEQEGERTRINLDGIPDGHAFELRVRLNTRVEAGAAGDNGALARLGDPLVYKSGFRMNYGRFGDLPLKKGISRSAPSARAGIIQAAGQPPVVLTYLSKTNFYYRLYQGANANTDVPPLAMKLGVDGDDTMTDPNPVLAEPTEDDYTLENQPINQPLDFDGDGIDDVYELRRPGILNPLNDEDAFVDSDGDGRSNLEEYQQGTDPQTPDSPPTSPTLNFPGLLVPTYDGGELIDINNDGLLDSAGPAMSISLAHLGGTFDTQVTSPRPGVRIVSATAYVKLDGDAFPDAVIVDQLTNRVFTFRGVGDGTFVPLNIDLAINSPNSIALCNLNGDALQDIAIFSQNGRGVDLHLNNGDGTLTRLTTVTTNAYGSGNSFAMADLNNDSRDDIIVGYAFNVAVFLTQPNGTYGLAQAYPVGSFPSSVAAGDLNNDGRLDLVAANASTDDVSVLIASAPGVFLPEVRHPIGDNPRQVRLARLRANGPLDAVVTFASADYQVILPGAGNGAFGSSYTVGTGTSLAAIHDWNSDGKLDLVGTVSSSGGLIILGNGDGTFDTRLQIVPTNTPPTQVTAVDLNGDGKLELVGLQTQLNSVDVWEHAAVTGTNRLLASFVVGTRVTGYVPGDFNGDGRIDLAVTTQTNSFGVRGSNQVAVLTNAGNFVFQDAGHYPLDWSPNSVVTADFDGDGDLDLAANLGGGTLVGGSRIVSLLNNGAGVFQTGTPTVVGSTLSAFLPVNAETDARTELFLRGSRIVGSTSVNFLEVFALDASGGWTNRQTLVATNVVWSQQLALVNGDSYPDLVVSQRVGTGFGGSLRIYPGGPAGFGAEQVVEAETEFSTFARLADLNGDGLLDVAAFNTIYLAKPGGGFHPAQPIYIGAAGAQGVADFNGDGKPDLLNGLSVLLQR
ncbi:MAG: VCBS repeat-containing protein [Verrucomicrobia bacterium]|nr:VCBS repeat-containing protein [Verrucomicrobiota bacterium]